MRSCFKIISPYLLVIHRLVREISRVRHWMQWKAIGGVDMSEFCLCKCIFLCSGVGWDNKQGGARCRPLSFIQFRTGSLFLWRYSPDYLLKLSKGRNVPIKHIYLYYLNIYIIVRETGMPSCFHNLFTLCHLVRAVKVISSVRHGTALSGFYLNLYRHFYIPV